MSKSAYQAISREERQRVVKLAAKMSNLHERVLESRRRVPEVARWRWVMLHVFHCAGYSSTQIAEAFDRDHTSVLRSVRLVKASEELLQLSGKLAHVAGLRPTHGDPSVAMSAVAAESDLESAKRETARQAAVDAGVRAFDQAIARIDRALSEIMIQVKLPQDPPDAATLRHHAGDLILSGVAILRRLGKLGDLVEYLPKETR